jgi:hypothetical protein
MPSQYEYRVREIYTGTYLSNDILENAINDLGRGGFKFVQLRKEPYLDLSDTFIYSIVAEREIPDPREQERMVRMVAVQYEQVYRSQLEEALRKAIQEQYDRPLNNPISAGRRGVFVSARPFGLEEDQNDDTMSEITERPIILQD